jgi:LacI family transcriptional regulator
MGQQVTMETVAERSGVSVSTVSLVLRDKPGINAETRKRVLLTARKLGYQRKYLTESQPTTELSHIGLVMKSRIGHSDVVNQFYSPVIAGIENTCRNQRINLLYATIPVDEDNRPLELPRLFFDSHVDGVLLVGAFADELVIRAATEKSIPLVLVDAYAPIAIYDSVVSDNVQGAKEAVHYLIQQGHRHIGMVGSLARTYPSIDDRRSGYVQALHDAGITETYFGDSHWQGDEVYEATTKLIQRHPQITALFGANDATAIGAMRAAQALGRRIPKDLSIIGFDDIDRARDILPPLTTMQVDKLTMGRLAVQLLANRVEYPEAATVTTVIRPRLIERRSVAASPGSRPDSQGQRA